MADEIVHHRVEVTDGDQVVTFADVDTGPAVTDPARAAMHAQAGHLPTGSRAGLVDAVLDLPDVQDSGHMHATVPLGDAETLHRIHDRCESVTTRAAGSSVLVEADTPGHASTT